MVFAGVRHGPKNRLDFGGNLDCDPYLGFLNPDQVPDPDFFCPTWLLSLSVEDISSFIFVIYSFVSLLAPGLYVTGRTPLRAKNK